MAAPVPCDLDGAAKMARTSPTRPVAALNKTAIVIAFSGLLLLARGWTARADGTSGQLVVKDEPTCDAASDYRAEQCPLAAAVRSYICDRRTMAVSYRAVRIVGACGVPDGTDGWAGWTFRRPPLAHHVWSGA